MANILDGVLNLFFGKKSDKDIKEVMPVVHQTLEAYNQLTSLSNDELRARSSALKKRVREHIKEEEEAILKLKERIEKELQMDIATKEQIYAEIDSLTKQSNEKIDFILWEVLPEAFAIVKDTARRFFENDEVVVTATEMDRELAATRPSVIIEGDKARYNSKWMAGGNEIRWDMIHYDVQLIGGIVLHQGKIAEMATGEGKTLVATLPVFLNALTGKGVHLVTVNDYLAKRDSEWMGPMYEFHGLVVDCIDKHEPNSEERKKAYQADITFGTNNEFGFDYLRDNMARGIEEIVQRPHNYAIVDEVDSVLIDDARTPLIISGPIPKGDKQEFLELRPRVEKLVNAQRNYINQILAESKKNINDGNDKDGGFMLLRSFRGLPKYKALIKFLSEPGVRALLQKTENYYMQNQNKEMWRIDQELFFVIDEKNNTVELTDKGIDLISNSAEEADFFIIPNIGEQVAEIEKSGLSEKDQLLKKSELLSAFSIKSERVHAINQLLKAYALFEKDVEYVVMDNKIKIVDEQTGRILEGRRYSDGLHQAIEAKENVKIEAATQTFATITLQNFFRMYRKLAGMTGTAETEAGEFWKIYKLDVVVIPTNKPIQRKDHNDLVYKTVREKYNAVIAEIQECVKNGRPVLVGTTSVEISELLSRALKMRGIKHNVLNAKQHQREAEIVAEAGRAGSVTIATNMAGRGTDIKLREGVKEAGGLAIVGTERHESRRVDRQLRGRAGRQGDPGSSKFYVSLEDNLMRLFGSERIAKMMDRLGIKEGEVIQHSMITRSIERAQRKVEENNFGIRKRLLEYDDVMNSQREVIYTKRRNALYGEKLAIDISNMISDVCDELTNHHLEERDYEGFRLSLFKTFGMDSPVSEEEFFKADPNTLIDDLFAKASLLYKTKNNMVMEMAMPVISNVFLESGERYENIVVPMTDGFKTLHVATNLKKTYETECRELIVSFEKSVTLALIDETWKEHLREMDDLKQSVQNATYEQKDPLQVYIAEAFKLFMDMIQKLNKDVISFLFKANLPKETNNVRQAQAPARTDNSKLTAGRSEVGDTRSAESKRTEPVRTEKKVGRNEPCPCGSGKKYKQCHGK